MLRAGLTGGIACGKSTVAGILRELGAKLIEADTIAHRVIEPGGAAYHDVAREFGREVLDAEGRVDRGRLGRIVFADSQRLAALNRIVHPQVIAAAEKRFEELEGAGAAVAILEAALLYEAGYAEKLQRIIVAWCRPEQQLERLVERGLAREEAERRLAAQMPIDEKRRRADDVIDCSGTLKETGQQTETLYARLVELARA